jgi:glycosyltransferase involved in cell wall biosynthesis
MWLRDILKKLQPDIIHVQTHLNFTAIEASLIANRLEIPMVTTIHGVIAKVNPLIDTCQLIYLYTIGRIIFKNSRRIICLTEHDAFDVVALGCPNRKIRIVPNGVDTKLFAPRTVHEDNLIVWHGRYVPQKGLEHMVRAAAIIAKMGNPRVRFALVGHGPLKAKIISMAENLKLTDNITFLERLPSLRDVAMFLGKASIYAIPSEREGMPWALLEAMSCGIPVVGSDISGINDVITQGDNGLLIPSRNPKALADAILTLLNDDSLKRRIGNNARLLMVEKYSWKIIADRMERVYEEALVGARCKTSR